MRSCPGCRGLLQRSEQPTQTFMHPFPKNPRRHHLVYSSYRGDAQVFTLIDSPTWDPHEEKYPIEVRRLLRRAGEHINDAMEAFLADDAEREFEALQATIEVAREALTLLDEQGLEIPHLFTLSFNSLVIRRNDMQNAMYRDTGGSARER